MRKKSFTLMLLSAMLWLLGGNAWAIEQDANGVYQIATAQDLADFAGLVNSGNSAINGVITADIDYTEQTALIGSAIQGKVFAGTLDGQGHTVTVNFKMTEARTALVCYTSAAAVVRNIIVDGTITTPLQRAAGIVSYNCGLVENCVFKGTINSSFDGESTHGGICGSCNEGSKVRNCLFAGKIIGEDTKQVGGIIGWVNTTNSALVTIENCMNIGEIDVKGDAHVIACSPKPTVMSNTYYLEGTSLVVDANATAMTSEELAGGKIAYKLGWGQNIGTDATPSPLNATTVYAVGRKHCDGTDYEGVTYNNEGGAAQVDDHVLEDGICSVCGQIPTDEEGYLLLGTAKTLKIFAEKVNAGQTTLKARLTADIDYTEESTIIGDAIGGIAFSGTLDGQGHTVTINLVMSKARQALISYTSASAVIRNLVVDGTITAAFQRTAGIVAYNCGLVENCVFLGTINSSFSGETQHAGICGSCNEGSVLRNCLFAGKITGDRTQQVGGMVGWVNTTKAGAVTIENCLNIGDIEVFGDAHVMACNPGPAIINNCYYLEGSTLVKDHDAKTLASEDIESGKAAFMLGWGQKLGTDERPVPFNTTDMVYAVGHKHCDGSDYEDVTYNNEGGSAQTDEHSYVDGFCEFCGQMPIDEEGYLLLSNAKALKKFADMVNAGDTNLKAKLTDDIDYTEESTLIGSTSKGKQYGGIFDGQGHTVTVNFETTEDKQALFCYTSSVATIRNLCVDGTVTTSYIRTAGVVSYNCGTVENCVFKGTIDSKFTGSATHGGICATCNEGSVVRNCLFSGKIEGSETYDCGGIIGWLNGKTVIENCMNIGQMNILTSASTKVIARYSEVNGKLSNNYCLEGSEFTVDQGVVELTEEDITNGKAAYQLSWGQKIGTDEMPLPYNTTDIVYAAGEFRCDGEPLGDIEYSNDPSSSTSVPSHEFENGFCGICGAIDEEYKVLIDGAYDLSTAEDIIWFGKMIELKGNKLNARLTQDINMGSVMDDFKPLGGTQGYGGTFDGQGHTISEFVYESYDECAGFFTAGIGGMVLKNIIFDNTCSILTINRFAGIVGGSPSGTSGTLTFENVGNEGNVTATGVNAGGIFGCNRGSVNFIFKNCYVTGKIQGSAENGAFAGWIGACAATLTGCWSNAEVIGIESHRDMIRHDKIAPVMTNCYSTSEEGQFTHIDADDLENGSLCWKLNGESFLNAAWYQTPGVGHPSFNSEDGLVYSKGEEGFACVKDENSYAEFHDYIIESAKNMADNTVANQQLIDNYIAKIEKLTDIDNLDDFLLAYPNTRSAQKELNASIAAYKAYDEACQYAINYLKENEFSCDERTLLESYLNDNIEPGEQFANGSYRYIWDTHTLTDAEIAAETKLVGDMLTAAIAADYQPGTEITDLMANASLAEGFNGWETENKAQVFRIGGAAGKLPAGEAYNSIFSMKQTLNDLKPGVYMLQANAAFRAGGDLNNTFYGAMLKLNDACNYVMTEGEDIVTTDMAEDGVNCHITGNDVDYTYASDEGEGYVPRGPEGSSYAFTAGRYLNYVAATVGEEGQLTIALENKGTGMANDWTGFGNFHLFYLGTDEQANDKLADVLSGCADRAQTILAFPYTTTEEYPKYPNISEQLKEDLQAAIDAIDGAETGAQKMELIDKFSTLFQEVYACRKAYIELANAAEKIAAIADEFFASNIISQEELYEATDNAEDAWDAYSNGTLSAKEAQEMAERISAPSFMPAIINDVYQIATPRDLTMFATIVNVGNLKANAVLTADIDYTEQTAIIGSAVKGIAYGGTFDGQGHTVTIDLVMSEQRQSLFSYTSASAVIRNLTVDGTITAPYQRAAGIVSYNCGTVENCAFLGTINSSFDGESTHSGICGSCNDGSVVRNCLFAGKIIGERTKQVGGIIGWVNTTKAATIVIENCLSIGEIDILNDAHVIACNPNPALIKNCYYQEGSTLIADHDAKTLTSEDLTSGKATYLLNNKSTENPNWFQTLGEDEHPVLDKTHKIVGFENDRYFNIEPRKKGDISGDGTVDGSDIVAAVNLVNGVGDEALAAYADLDNDGTIDGKDVVILVNIVCGTEVKEFKGVITLKGKRYFVKNGVIVVE